MATLTLGAFANGQIALYSKVATFRNELLHRVRFPVHTIPLLQGEFCAKAEEHIKGLFSFCVFLGLCFLFYFNIKTYVAMYIHEKHCQRDGQKHLQGNVQHLHNCSLMARRKGMA